MINSVEITGLKVDFSTPKNYSVDVDLNTIIEVKFNSELDTNSIVGNFYVLKDSLTNNKTSDSIDINKYDIVKGSLTYKDKSIIFKPIGQLDRSSRYIVYVPRGSIRDFEGRVTLVDVLIRFDTCGDNVSRPCSIIYPKDNSVITSLNQVEVEDLGVDRYIIQISKNKSFENGIHDIIVDSNIVNDTFNLGEGSYYIRARAFDGPFGDSSFFTISTFPDTLVSDEDEPFMYQPLEEDTIELLESFPSGINLSEKTNLAYLKFDGIIPLDEIDFEESFLKGTLSDSNDFGSIDEHDVVDGSFSVVYDTDNSFTYIMFIPDQI